MAAKKILVIDDEPAFVEMLSLRFRASGFEVVTASDGLEALAQIARAVPDLIVLDVLMPNMNGLQFMQKLRENKKIPHIPVIVMSARGNMKDYFADLLIEQFVPKPFDTKVLLEQIGKYILPSSEKKAAATASTKQLLLVEVSGPLQNRIEDLFRSAGWGVLKAIDEDRACQLAHETPPALILARYWDPKWEGGVLDTYRLSRLVADDPALARVPFYVHCLEENHSHAKSLFPERLIRHKNDDDLLPLLSEQFDLKR